MKIQNGVLINAMIPALQELGRKELPIASALKVRRMVRAVSQNHQDVLDVWKQIAEKWTKKDDDGEPVWEEGRPTFDAPEDGEIGEDEQSFLNAQTELLSHEWEYDGPVLTEKDLGTITVSPNLLMALDSLLEDEGKSEG